MQKTQYLKRLFNPENKEDLAVYRRYIQTKGWGADGCPFKLEYPYQDIPNMVAQKIAKYAVENFA